MKDPTPGWTVERFERTPLKVFCTHEDGTVELFTVMSVVRTIDQEEITVRIVPPVARTKARVDGG